jgi:hypothetical protein
VGGWFGGTRIEGSSTDILALQLSSMHYYQRPDADYVQVNPTATSLSGWGGKFSLAKQQGNLLVLAHLPGVPDDILHRRAADLRCPLRRLGLPVILSEDIVLEIFLDPGVGRHVSAVDATVYRSRNSQSINGFRTGSSSVKRVKATASRKAVSVTITAGYP